jgi:LemA protein
MSHFLRATCVMTLVVALVGCGINNIPSYDEKVKASWGQVQYHYHRRADLIPNLVATVKGVAAHERETLTAVTQARAKVGSMQVTPDLLNNPQAMQAFEGAQSELSSALSRLMVVVERYPDLKANESFLTLQSQLEGTENRIAVARRDYIAAVEIYNREIRTFPGRIWHSLMYSDMQVRETYVATTENAEQAPAVNF